MPTRRKPDHRVKQTIPAHRSSLPVYALAHRFQTAVLLSLIVHTVLIFGFIAQPVNPTLFKSDKPLQVVLVNARSESKPLKADVLAQANLNGGGEVKEDVHASTPLPASETDSAPASAKLDQQIQEQETKVNQLLTQLHSKYAIDSKPPSERPQEQPATPSPNPDLVTNSLAMARIEARINDEYSTYEKRPRRVFVGSRAQEYSYARYVEDWRLKVERIGNLNYPEAARRGHIYGALVLTVNIRSDGSLENVEVERSSGSKVLDAAAVKIVQMSAPFAPFTPEMRKTVDVLGITRVWNFTNSDRLTSGSSQ